MNNGSDELLLDGDVLIPRTRNAMKCFREPRACLWPKSANGNVEIPFLISEKYDRAERNTILTAMKDFASKTCIRFIPRTTQTRHISIEPRLGCFSLLGYVGGRQVVSLQKFGCVTHGITQHELLHSMGFYHEQSRSDRDQYVRINWDNIRTSYLSNFKKEDTNNLNTPYDYSSIMHYGRTAFGKHGSETITPFPDPSVPIGQRDRLSDFDILKINKLYKCWNYLCCPCTEPSVLNSEPGRKKTPVEADNVPGLGTGREEDALLRDTIEAAKWCTRQTLKGKLSLPQVISMDQKGCLRAVEHLRMSEGLEGMTKPKDEGVCPVCGKSLNMVAKHIRQTHMVQNKAERAILNNMATGRTIIPPGPCPIPGCRRLVLHVAKHLKGHTDITVRRMEEELAKKGNGHCRPG
ncbi:Low choriolytic enzyme [Larimichthys crocea]|uniref:Metalloendopeptidase n=1 Tax=Larimichthys crocea TaxID=215358 RepID=A0A6G0HGB6_LARCR|nr:Low choriolytic enzyme [Larimichthys crocea]